jgi:hypothetical protein
MGAICCLLPIHYQEFYIEESQLNTALKTIEFTIFSAVCFTLAAPLVINFLIEVIVNATNDRNIHSKSAINVLFLTDIEKLLFIMGVISVPIIAVLPDLNNLALVYACCLRSQFMLTIGIVIASMSRYDKGFWPTLLCTISLILLAFGMISAAFATNLYENNPVTRICHFTWNFSWYFVVLSAVIFLLVCVHYLIKIFRKVKKSSSVKIRGKEGMKSFILQIQKIFMF